MSLVPALGVLASVPAGRVAAQTSRAHQLPDTHLRLELIYPHADDTDLEFPSFAAFLEGRATISDRVALRVEIPFATGEFGSDSEAPGRRQTAIGNPYVGVEMGRPESPWSFDLGGRLPLAPEDNLGSLVGLMADPVGRTEAFFPKVVSGHARATVLTPPGERLRIGGHIGSTVGASTEGGDAEVWALLGGELAWVESAAGVSIAIQSRYLLSEGGDFSQLSSWQGDVRAWTTIGRLRPGVLIRLPLDGLSRDFLDVAIGVSAGVALR